MIKGKLMYGEINGSFLLMQEVALHSIIVFEKFKRCSLVSALVNSTKVSYELRF